MLCAVFSWSPLACGRVPYPPYARCGMGRLCGERRRRERFERLKGAKGSACPVGTWAEGPKRPEAGQRNHERAEGKRQPGGLLREAQSDPQADRETSGGRAPRPPRRLSGHKRKRHAVREARMIEQPGARNAACSTRHRPPPGLPPAPAVGWFGGVRRPLQVYSESSDMRGGFGSLAQARLPYAGRRLRRREACALWALARSAKRPVGVSKYKGCARPARRTPIFARCRRQSRRRSRRPAQPPSEKIGASRAFPTSS